MRKIKVVAMIIGVTLLISAYALNHTLNKSDTMNKISILEKVEKANNVDMNKTNSFEFRLNDINGVPHSLSDYKGKKVYLKYWASWCPICLSGMDEFDQLVRNNASSEQMVVLSVVSPGAFGEKSEAQFIKWYKERGYTVPVLFDDGGIVARQIGIRAFPTSVYIGSDGAIVAVNPGQTSNEMITGKMATVK